MVSLLSVSWISVGAQKNSSVDSTFSPSLFAFRVDADKTSSSAFFVIMDSGSDHYGGAARVEEEEVIV